VHSREMSNSQAECGFHFGIHTVLGLPEFLGQIRAMIDCRKVRLGQSPRVDFDSR